MVATRIPELLQGLHDYKNFNVARLQGCHKDAKVVTGTPKIATGTPLGLT